MGWQVIVIMAIMIPIILFPAAVVWFISASGLYQVIRDSMRRRARAEKRSQVTERTR